MWYIKIYTYINFNICYVFLEIVYLSSADEFLSIGAGNQFLIPLLNKLAHLLNKFLKYIFVIYIVIFLFEVIYVHIAIVSCY